MGERSLGVPTLLGGDEALAWHAPGGVLRPPYLWRRLSFRARAPEQHSGTPSKAISVHARFEPCEACCEQAMGARSLGAPTWLGEGVALAWHAPGGVTPPAYQWRRLSLRARAHEQHSGTPSRAISAHARFEPCEACCEQAMGARSLGAPTWLGEGVALAWHAPGGAPPLAYHWCSSSVWLWHGGCSVSIDPGDRLHGWYSLHNVRALHKRSANDCTMVHGIIHAADNAAEHWRVLWYRLHR